MDSLDTPPRFRRKGRLLKIVLGPCLAAVLICIAVFLLTKAITEPPPKPFSYTRLSQPVVKVPLRLVRGRPVVEVMLNERGPYRLMLDTGCSHTVHICACLVKELGLSETDTKVTANHAGGTTREYSVVRVDSLRVGQAEFLRFEALVDPIGHRLSTKDTRVDGMIGNSCFRELLLTLDFPNRQLILQKGALPKPDGRDVLELSPGNRTPEIVATIGQTELKFAIDSGFNGAVTLPEAIAKTSSFYATPVETRSSTGGGVVSSYEARLRGTVAFGRHAVADPIVHWFAGTKGMGMIGMKVLKHFAVTLDQTSGSVRFSRNDDNPIRIPPRRGIGLIFEVKNAIAAIEVINPNMPAAHLGLEVGDQVLTVNGEPFSEFDDSRFSALFEKTDPVRLELMRGEKRFTVEVPVVNLIE